MLKFSSQLFAAVLSFLTVAFSLICATATHWFSSNSKLFNKVVKLWVVSQDELPYSVAETQNPDEKAIQLDTVESANVNSWSENCPAFLKNYPRSQKRSNSKEKAQSQSSEPSQTLAATVSDSEKDATNQTSEPQVESAKFNAESSFRIQKLSMPSIRAKLEEYNAINTQYVVCKHLEKHNANEVNTMQLNQLINSKEIDYSVICKFMFPSVNPLVLSKLNSLPKYKSSKHRRQYSFQPTKLTTIFENLAY